MVNFTEIIGNLVDIGFYQVVLPFLLIYVVVFAILEKSGIFKGTDTGNAQQTKNVNSVIAFVFGLIAVASVQTVMYLQNLITIIITFIIFILVVLILLGFIFGEKYTDLFMNNGNLKTPIAWVIAIVVLGVAIIALAVVTGTWDWLVDWWNDFDGGDTLWSIVVVGLIAGVLYWVSKGSN